MKRFWAALFLCAALFVRAAPVSAQDRADVTLYFTPATGGSAEDRAFFDRNVPGEINSPHIRVGNSRDEADFLVSLTITEQGESGVSTLSLGLTAAEAVDGSPPLELFWHYRDAGEMYGWHIGEFLSSGTSDDAGTRNSPRQRRGTPLRFFAGFKGGAAFSGRYFQSTPGYYSGYSNGIGAEGGLVLELRVLRFLAFQTEADFVYDVFEAPEAGTEGARSVSSLSLSFPLLVKVPLSFEAFTLAPYAGVYYTLGLGETTRMDLPLGFTVGTDLGFPMGPGEMFGDIRYGRDLGAAAIGKDGPEHIRDRISLGLGYKFGF
jgi:hypothetical protein